MFDISLTLFLENTSGVCNFPRIRKGIMRSVIINTYTLGESP